MKKNKLAMLVLGTALATGYASASETASAKCGAAKCGSKNSEKPADAK